MAQDVEIRVFTVGPVAENCFVVRHKDSDRVVIVDPGDEADRILAPVRELNLEVEAILLTHCHFDHVGAVAPIARETGAPVYCPADETAILADIESYTWPGIGPYESYHADEAVSGGERLEFAGLAFDVLPTPGHSPGHVTYAVPDHGLLLSGDVLFQGSVGRVDLPGGDWPTLLESIRLLYRTQDEASVVLCGHGPATDLATERSSNPFLSELGDEAGSRGDVG